MSVFQERCNLLAKELNRLHGEKFTGKQSFEINWSQGGITHITSRTDRTLTSPHTNKEKNGKNTVHSP